MKDSTTLKLDVGGKFFFLECLIGETIEVGSDPECKLSLDAEGISPRHCYVKRIDDVGKFVVSTKNPKTKIKVNGVSSSEMNVRSPFTLGIAGQEIGFCLVADSEAEGFEEIETPIEHSESESQGDLMVRHRRSAIPVIRFRSRKKRSREKESREIRSPEKGNGPGSQRPKPVPHLPPIPDWRKIATKPNESRELKESRTNEPLSTISLKFFLQSIATVFAIVLLGLGWFQFREWTLIKNPTLLAKKAEAGNEYAQATLGFSRLFGEWNSEADFDEARKLLFEKPGTTHPLAIYGAAFFREQGYFANPDPDATRQQIDRALKGGLVEMAQNSSDPRFKTLAALAEFSIRGEVAENTLPLLESASKSGYPLAGYLLAEMAEKGQLGLPLDGNQVADYWQKSARNAREEAGDASVIAQTLLGRMHIAGKFSEASPDVGVEFLENAAEAGFPPARFYLAQYLAERDGAISENETAKKWMFEAAGQGYVEARGGLSEFIYYGIGDKKNPDFALNEIARPAARDGSRIAIKLLAKHSPDKNEVLRMAERLTKFGDTEGAALAGEIYISKGLVPEAIAYYKKAAAQNDTNSMLALGQILMDSPEHRDFDAAESWLRRAAEAGSTEAEVSLAIALDHPARENRDPEQAFEVLKKLTNDGDQVAAVSLSKYYLEGRGMDSPDATRAFFLLKQASDAGEKTAHFPLGELYESGTGTGIKPNLKLPLAAYEKALKAGDDRAVKKFEIADVARKVFLGFVESWQRPDPQSSRLFLVKNPLVAYGLEKPEDREIEIYERGFRGLWTTRSFNPDSDKTTSEIVALDEVHVESVVTFRLSRGGEFEQTGEFLIKAIVNRIDDAWKIESFEETITSPQMLVSKGMKSIREIFPESRELDSSNKIPPKLRKNAASYTIRDSFGHDHKRIPTDVRENIVTLTDPMIGGDLFVPVFWFDETAVSKIRSALGGGITHRFDEMLNGIQVDPDWNNPVVANLKRRADQGDSEAMALIGENYFDGLGGFPVDPVEAVKWFAKASQKGNSLGRAWLGILISIGEIKSSERAEILLQEIVPDLATTIASPNAHPSYFRAAAEARAIVESSGWNDSIARQLLERAVQKNDPRALYIQAEIFNKNNDDLRMKTLLRAEVAGSTLAAIRLAESYTRSKKFPTEQFRLFKKSAEKGAPAAQLYLAQCYNGGIGTAADSAAAAFYTQLAVLTAGEFKLKETELDAKTILAQLEKGEHGDDVFRAREFFNSTLGTGLAPPAGSQSIPSMREWRTLTGHKIQSEYVRIDEDTVIFRLASDTPFAMPFALLNDEDRKFAESRR